MSMNPHPNSIALRLMATLISVSLVAPPLAAQTAAKRPTGHSPALKSGEIGRASCRERV